MLSKRLSEIVLAGIVLLLCVVAPCPAKAQDEDDSKAIKAEVISYVYGSGVVNQVRELRPEYSSKQRFYYKVILPLATPALVITALFSFMTAWAEYLVAAQILQDSDLWTLPLGLKSFEANMSTEWGLYGASSIIVAIPVVVLFLALSKYLVSGLTLGSVKG